MKSKTQILLPMIILSLLWLSNSSVFAQRDGEFELGDSRGHVFEIEFTPDGKFIAVAHSDGVVMIDVHTGKSAFAVDSPACRRIAITNNSQSVFLIHDDVPNKRILAKACVWDFLDSDKVGQPIKHDKSDLSFHEFVESPDGRKFVSTSRADNIDEASDETRTLFSFCEVSEMGTAEEQLAHKFSEFRNPCFLDPNTCLALRDRRFLDFYDVDDWSITKSIELQGGEPHSIQVAEGTIMVLGVHDPESNPFGDVFWKIDSNLDVASSVEAKKLPKTEKDQPIAWLQLSPNGQSVATQTNRIVQVGNVSAFMPVFEIRKIGTEELTWSVQARRSGYQLAMAWSPDATMFAYCHSERLVILNGQTGEVIKEVEWNQE